MQKCCDMRGFLSFLVLRLIKTQPRSGEDIRQELERRRGSRPSPGTIYPVLKSLSNNGWIEEIKGGGKEKRYRITPAGKKELDSATKKFVSFFCDMKDEFR